MVLFSSAKIVQIECRISSLLEYYAEMQPIFCKDTHNIVFSLYLKFRIYYLDGFFICSIFSTNKNLS